MKSAFVWKKVHRYISVRLFVRKLEYIKLLQREVKTSKLKFHSILFSFLFAFFFNRIIYKS